MCQATSSCVSHPSKDKCTVKYTLYRVMKSSIEGIESLTSLSMVMYWERSLVHAGEYLFREECHLSRRQYTSAVHSLCCCDCIPYIGALEVIQRDNDAEKRG